MARPRHFRRFPTINGFAFDFSRVTKKPSFSSISAKRRKL
jgi:hypothetical protein